MPETAAVGKLLADKAVSQGLLTYEDVRRAFPDLPAFNGIWEIHPLCHIFGDLDREDSLNKRPFRTALVVHKGGDKMPGPGFFKSLQELRVPMPGGDNLSIWSNELRALHA